MTLKKISFLPNLFRQWIGLNILAFGIATPLCFSIGISDLNIEMLFLSGLIVGSITGLLQPIVLRKRLPRLRYWQWIFANILGGYIGIFGGGTMVAQILPFFSASLPGLSVTYLACLIFGACVGIALSMTQLIVLLFVGRGILIWHVSNILGRAIAWVGGSVIVVALWQNMNDIQMPVWVSLPAGIVGGGIYGVVTGLALPYLQPKAKKINAEELA